MVEGVAQVPLQDNKVLKNLRKCGDFLNRWYIARWHGVIGADPPYKIKHQWEITGSIYPQYLFAGQKERYIIPI